MAEPRRLPPSSCFYAILLKDSWSLALSVRAVASVQPSHVPNTGFHVQPRPRSRVLPGLSAASVAGIAPRPGRALPPSSGCGGCLPRLPWQPGDAGASPALLPHVPHAAAERVSAAPCKKSPCTAVALGGGHPCLDGGGQEGGFCPSAGLAVANCDGGSLNSEMFLSPGSGFWKSSVQVSPGWVSGEDSSWLAGGHVSSRGFPL